MRSKAYDRGRYSPTREQGVHHFHRIISEIHEKTGDKMEDTPLLTMTKSRIVGEEPNISDESKALLDTLSSLCSFHSCEDLASFLFTDMFRNLVGRESHG